MTAVAELTGADLALWGGRAASADFGPDCHQGEYIIIGGHSGTPPQVYAPHEDWAQGGPLIKQYNIQLGPPTNPVHRCGGPNGGRGQSGVWTACTWTRGANGRRSIALHETEPLVAAMRCIVRVVYGDTVPDEVSS